MTQTSLDRKFGLAESCFLVEGAKRGAIYALNQGHVFSIDETAKEIIALAENGATVKGIAEQLADKVSEQEILDYLGQLESARLGRFLSIDESIEKIDISSSGPTLDFIWLEVTAGCNLKCVHCCVESVPQLIGKERMAVSDWVRVMREAYDLGCRRLQFIGGEPFAIGDNLLELIKEARRIGFEFVEIYTNGTLLTEARIDFLVEHDVAMGFSFYGLTAETHEAITLGKGSHQKTLASIKRCVERGLRVRVGVIAMSTNEDVIDETIEFLQRETGVVNVGLDLVRPSGRGCDSDLVPKKLQERQMLRAPRFGKCTVDVFRRNKHGHNCFYKEVYVAASGDIFPCIMERGTSFGNVCDEDLAEILEKSETKRIRATSKDHVETCCDCEYRYTCFDCRPKAKGASPDQNFYAKPGHCTYDPYTGVWS